jgi:hypothetical protein
MKTLLAVAAVFLVPACSYAQDAKAAPAAQAPQVAKPCEELKSEIAAKLDAKGVKSYTLDVVTKETDVTDGKVVGTCEGGSKKIVYKKGAAPAPAKDAAKEPAKP